MEHSQLPLKRGFLFEIEANLKESPLKLFLWLTYVYHKFFILLLLFDFLLFCIILTPLSIGISPLLASFFMVETIAFSTITHEFSHLITGIKLLGKDFVRGISLVPYTHQIWARFTLDYSKSPEDAYVTLLAGPLFPLIIATIALCLFFIFDAPLWYYIYPILFGLPNLISFLPVDNFDGKQIKRIKEHRKVK